MSSSEVEDWYGGIVVLQYQLEVKRAREEQNRRRWRLWMWGVVTAPLSCFRLRRAPLQDDPKHRRQPDVEQHTLNTPLLMETKAGASCQAEAAATS